jgi:hypothetical protein
MTVASFFHSRPADADPQRLLDPACQFTEPWGEDEEGRPCDKCGGSGSALYECRSCLQTGSRADCPACQGRVRFHETCPTCMGGGVVTHTRRRGVAVFPAREGLYRYLAEKGADVAGKVVVELRGRLSEDRDLDADTGALLLLPDEVVAVQPLDPELVAAAGANRRGSR